MHILKQGIANGVVLRDFSAIDSIIQLFPADYRIDIKQAFQCTSIDDQFNLIGEADIESIKSQIIDKIDIESVEALKNVIAENVQSRDERFVALDTKLDEYIANLNQISQNTDEKIINSIN